MKLLRCYIQYDSKFVKLSSGQRIGKDQSTSQSQRRAVPKNAPTTVQLHSFHTLPRLCSNSYKAGFSSMWTETSQKYKLDFEGADELEREKSNEKPRQHLKKQMHHLANKGPHSQSYGFSSRDVQYGSESGTTKKADHRKIDAFELWSWKRLLRVPGLQREQTYPF